MNQINSVRTSNVAVDIPSNELALTLSGEHDQNLQQIENALSISPWS